MGDAHTVADAGCEHAGQSKSTGAVQYDEYDERKGDHADRSKDSAIQPQRRAELVDAISQYVPLVRADPGVEAFYGTARKDDPNTFVFYEIYRSHAAQDFHLQQNFTKNFLATLKSAQIGDRVRVNLVEFPLEGQTHSN